ncbi:hypothetical protein BD310DRAFT_905676 [Dichomitus squalens]|uniref:Uncharacterized protein n=1 Tax=Dichomitus squalens TaxID=114155 RepID=A0A4V2K8G8_9APHY|nr:hypothetical protein BD310DRAFT_905676 [Dichomitus squalens]
MLPFVLCCPILRENITSSLQVLYAPYGLPHRRPKLRWAITSAIKAPLSDATTIVGTADGCMLSFTNEYEYVCGDAHMSLVAGLSAFPSGMVHSVGFDNRLRTVDGQAYTPSSFSTAAQLKAGVAVNGDSTVFVVEVESVEAVPSNQKVFDLPLKYSPSAIAASGLLVAVGGEIIKQAAKSNNINIFAPSASISATLSIATLPCPHSISTTVSGPSSTAASTNGNDHGQVKIEDGSGS